MGNKKAQVDTGGAKSGSVPPWVSPAPGAIYLYKSQDSVSLS